ncbi:MAG: sigma-70 family RNA polymerase sigma factor [Caldimonas sp.]
MKTGRQPAAAVARPPPRSAWLSIVTMPHSRSPMPTSEELNAWVQAVALTSDRRAFAALFKHFAPRVKSYLVRLGTSDATAEELTQEAMVNLWRKSQSFDGTRAGVSTWVFTIARNLRVDHFRRQGNRSVDAVDSDDSEMPDELPQPGEQLAARQREDGVRLAMAQLSSEQAQVLRLSFYEEQPHAQIARELGIPLGTVKSRVRLAVTHLRRALEGFAP